MKKDLYNVKGNVVCIPKKYSEKRLVEKSNNSKKMNKMAQKLPGRFQFFKVVADSFDFILASGPKLLPN